MQTREKDSGHNPPQFIETNAARSRRADTGYFESALEQGEMEGWHTIWTAKFLESGDSVGCLLPVATLAPATGELLRLEVAAVSGLVCRKLESRVERGDADLYDKPIMVTVITFTFDKIRVLQADVGRPTTFYPSRDSKETPHMRPQTNISVRLNMDTGKVIGLDSDTWQSWSTVLSWVLFYSPVPHMEYSEEALQTPSEPDGTYLMSSSDPSGTIPERLFSGSEPNGKGDSSQSS